MRLFGFALPGPPAAPASGPKDPIQRAAATLSLIEIGLGSLLHASRWPLSGQALSLNQGFFLARAEHGLRGQPDIRWAAARISSVVALLKSLSPAGRRLTPMLAISVQGLLFNLGVFALGRGALGLALGITLLGLWPIVQPLLMTAFFLDGTLAQAAPQLLGFLQRTRPGFMGALAWGLAILLGLKVVLGWALVWLAVRLPDERVRAYEERMTRAGLKIAAARTSSGLGSPASPGRKALESLFDLLRPAFLIPLGLTIGYAAYEHRPESQAIRSVMRPVALAWSTFFIVRLLPIERWLNEKNIIKT